MYYAWNFNNLDSADIICYCSVSDFIFYFEIMPFGYRKSYLILCLIVGMELISFKHSEEMYIQINQGLDLLNDFKILLICLAEHIACPLNGLILCINKGRLL